MVDRNEDQGPATGLAPHLTIGGGKALQAIDFYTRAFGAESPMAPHMADDGKRVLHGHLRINGGSVMLNDDFPEYRGGGAAAEPAGVTIHLQVKDPDAWFQHALDAGATETMPLADQFWGDRYGQIRDPFGHSWSIGGPVKG